MKFVCHILCKYLHTGHQSVAKPHTRLRLKLVTFLFSLTTHILTSPVSKGVFEERTVTGSGLFAFLASNIIQISGHIVYIKALSDTLC